METAITLLVLFTVIGAALYRHNNRPKSAGETIREFQFLSDRQAYLTRLQADGQGDAFVQDLRREEIREIETKLHGLKHQP
jgi:hypothetical protein